MVPQNIELATLHMIPTKGILSNTQKPLAQLTITSRGHGAHAE